MARSKKLVDDFTPEESISDVHNAPMEEVAPVARKKGEAINGVKLQDASHALPQEEVEHEVVKVKATNPAHLKPQA